MYQFAQDKTEWRSKVMHTLNCCKASSVNYGKLDYVRLAYVSFMYIGRSD